MSSAGARLVGRRGVVWTAIRVVAALYLSGCSDLTDATLGACVESTPEWCPLRPDYDWMYEQHENGIGIDTRKYLTVQHDRSEIRGPLGEETAVRTWRANVDSGDSAAAAWRWVIANDQGLFWRADIGVVSTTMEAPCASYGPDDDLRDCTEVVPTYDRTYYPMATRLDLRAEHLCERSAWSARYIRHEIQIGATDAGDSDLCGLETWRARIEDCPGLDTEITEEWSVQYLSRTIDVPAGHFEECLCVRRKGSADVPDSTFCFAKGIGKVYELERPFHVECLESYHIDDDTWGPPPDWEHGCDDDLVEP